jgi:predicted metalloprotease with PDZ domain
MALGIALELDVIDFKGFLNTLARAYDSYISKPDDSSLLEASESRWTTSGSQVYVKGFLVAFLYDLLARKESGGKTTLADRYRELFKGGGAEHAQGNEVIIKLLGSSPALGHFAKLYIENVQKLELDRELPAYGLQLEASGKGSQLRVSRELSAEQKLLLRSLGYRK